MEHTLAGLWDSDMRLDLKRLDAAINVFQSRLAGLWDSDEVKIRKKFWLVTRSFNPVWRDYGIQTVTVLIIMVVMRVMFQSRLAGLWDSDYAQRPKRFGLSRLFQSRLAGLWDSDRHPWGAAVYIIAQNGKGWQSLSPNGHRWGFSALGDDLHHLQTG